MDERTIARFWKKVDKNGPIATHVPGLGPCWLWTGATTKRGYGVFWDPTAEGRMRPATHVSWQLCNGFAPDNQYILHQCDTPACVNPEHLRIGTQLENIRDMKNKGRMPRGSQRGHAKLSETDVVAIRRLYAEGRKFSEIAKVFRVAGTTIRDVVLRRKWTHVL